MPFPVDANLVELAEQQLAVQFPPSYRARMLRENGGEVCAGRDVDDTFWLFPIRDDRDPKRLRRSWDDVVRQTRKARTRTGFPPSAIAIGSDGGGNLLTLLVHQAAWQVAVWDHETGELEAVVVDPFGW